MAEELTETRLVFHHQQVLRLSNQADTPPQTRFSLHTPQCRSDSVAYAPQTRRRPGFTFKFSSFTDSNRYNRERCEIRKRPYHERINRRIVQFLFKSLSSRNRFRPFFKNYYAAVALSFCTNQRKRVKVLTEIYARRNNVYEYFPIYTRLRGAELPRRFIFLKIARVLYFKPIFFIPICLPSRYIRSNPDIVRKIFLPRDKQWRRLD